MPRHANSSLKPHRRRTEEKLDLDDLIAAPNLGGMLSFLDVPPDEARRRHDLRRALDDHDVGTVIGSHSPNPTVGCNTIGVDATVVGASYPVVERPTVVHEPVDRSGSPASVADTQSATFQPTMVETPTEATYPSVGLHHTEDQRPSGTYSPRVPSPNASTVGAASPQPSEANWATAPEHNPAATTQDKPTVPLTPTVGETPTAQRRERVFRATLVQHGHSPAEQILYQALWNHGSSLTDGSRQITAGYRELGYMTNLNDKTIKYNLQSLQAKLAIQTLAPENTFTRTGRTYKVFSYDQILRRRAEAGLVWVRKTKGVEFVAVDRLSRPSIRYATTAPTSPTVVGTPSVPQHHDPYPVAEESEPTVVPAAMESPELDTTGTGVRGTTQIGSSVGNHLGTTTPSTTTRFPIALSKALSRLFPGIDHDAVETLWNECRNRAPDCTLDEILYFFNQKLPISRNGRIQNPVGFLLATVPKCFEGETFNHFRQEQARLKEEQQRREEEEHRKQQAIENELEQYHREEDASRKAAELLPTLSEGERRSLYEEARAEVSAKGYKAVGSIMEKVLQERVIRNLARKILSQP
jgi:hypothetical protein